jgi:hypothetical protein
MTTLLEAYKKIEVEDTEGHEIRVIKNSDTLFKQDVEWTQDIEYKEPNTFEKSLLKLSPEELLKQEEEEEKNKPIKTQEEIDKEYKEHYILKVKVIAMNKMGKSIISNPSYWKHDLKQQLIKEMQNILDNYSEEELKEKFNSIVNETLFDTNFNYDSFPLKRT